MLALIRKFMIDERKINFQWMDRDLATNRFLDFKYRDCWSRIFLRQYVFMHVFVRIMRIIFRVRYSFFNVKGLFLEMIFKSFNFKDKSKVAFIKIGAIYRIRNAIFLLLDIFVFYKSYFLISKDNSK